MEWERVRTVRQGAAIVALVTATLAVACSDSGAAGPASPTSKMAISVDSSYDGHVLVGSVYTIEMEIRNTGQADISKLQLMFDGGRSLAALRELWSLNIALRATKQAVTRKRSHGDD